MSASLCRKVGACGRESQKTSVPMSGHATALYLEYLLSSEVQVLLRNQRIGPVSKLNCVEYCPKWIIDR